MTFAVAGASGNSGRVVAETLLEKGHDVRVVVRDASSGAAWKARGADVAVADLGDAAALTRALRGTAGAYLLIPPSFTALSQRAHQAQITRALTAAVGESGVPHVVLLSAFAAHRETGSGPLAGLHEAERALDAIPGLRLSPIRAGYFHENLVPLLGVVKATGALPSFFPAALPVPMVGTRDIGLLAAELLLDPSASGVVELGSALTHAEIASVLGTILHRSIAVDEIALEAVPPTLGALGFSADLTALYVEMISGIRSGTLAFEGGHRRVEARSSLEALLSPLLAG